MTDKVGYLAVEDTFRCATRCIYGYDERFEVRYDMTKIKFSEMPLIVKIATIWILVKMVWWFLLLIANLILVTSDPTKSAWLVLWGILK
jgi:hypothetical protein